MNNKIESSYLTSAIVSTYNSEKFIRGCIESLISQTLYTYNKLEIIIIDSNSSQNEHKIVRELINGSKHIKYIKTKTRETIYKAWNRCCKIANGEFITNANTDDRHRHDAIERLTETLLLNKNAGVAYANSIVTKSENVKFGTAPVIGSFIWPAYDRTELFKACFIGPQPIWRKCLHDQYGYFDGTFKSAGDYEFWLRLAAAGVHFQHVPECLGLYLMAQDGVEHSNQNLSFQESEIARTRHWKPEWGTRPAPSGSYFVPMEVRWSKWRTEQSQAPLVSVIIPTKDRPEMLLEAVESALSQSYQNVEAVVINDGGHDVQHALYSLPNSSKITYIHLLQNFERSTARNCGLSLAHGQYIAYLDDDDIFYYNHIEIVLKQIMSSKYKVAYSDSLMAQQSSHNGKYKTYRKFCQYSKKFNYEQLLIDNYIPILCLVHEKKCLDKTGYFDNKISTHEDWDLWIRLSMYYKFLHIKNITSEFRVRNDNTNTSNSKFPKFLETYKYIYNKYPIQSAPNNSTHLFRKKTLFTITLNTYKFICNLISEINNIEYDKSVTEIQSITKKFGVKDKQVASAYIYLKAIAGNNNTTQRLLLYKSIKCDHENYLAWIALSNNYIEAGKFDLVATTLKTLIDTNPLEISLYDLLISVSKILSNENMHSEAQAMKDAMLRITPVINN